MVCVYGVFGCWCWFLVVAPFGGCFVVVVGAFLVGLVGGLLACRRFGVGLL